MAFSQRVYDHWKLAMLSYFAAVIADSVLRTLNFTFPTFTLRIVVELAPLPALIPGSLYILSEFARLLDGEDPSSKRLIRTFFIGFVLFFVFGLAIPRSYSIAFDAFQITLPYPSMLRYLLIGGDLAGWLMLGTAAIYARRIEPTYSPEVESDSIRLRWSEGLALIGFLMLMLGFTIGIGIFAFTALLLIVVGAILLTTGLIIRRTIASPF